MHERKPLYKSIPGMLLFIFSIASCLYNSISFYRNYIYIHAGIAFMRTAGAMVVTIVYARRNLFDKSRTFIARTFYIIACLLTLVEMILSRRYIVNLISIAFTLLCFGLVLLSVMLCDKYFDSMEIISTKEFIYFAVLFIVVIPYALSLFPGLIQIICILVIYIPLLDYYYKVTNKNNSIHKVDATRYYYDYDGNEYTSESERNAANREIEERKLQG